MSIIGSKTTTAERMTESGKFPRRLENEPENSS